MDVYTDALTTHFATTKLAKDVTKGTRIPLACCSSGRRKSRRASQPILLPVDSVVARIYGMKEMNNDVSRDGEKKRTWEDDGEML